VKRQIIDIIFIQLLAGGVGYLEKKGGGALLARGRL